MNNKNRLLLGILALLLAFGAGNGTGAAATKAADKKAAAQTQTKAPIVIEADKLYFSDLTGDLFAQGNVQVTQDQDKLFAALVQGNTKQGEVWVDGKATLVQPEAKLTGQKIRYNYQQKNGTIQNAAGTIGNERVSAQNIQILPNEMILHDGTMTKCPAQVPDYHISADKVEIWPGEKMIAYNAKFWIKDKVIFSLPKYQKSLRKKDSQSEFPRVGYYSEDGFYIKQYLETPVTENVAAFADLAYYTKSGFKPAFGLIDREKSYTFTVVDGDYRDSDGNWIKKEPEFKLDLGSRRLGSLPVSYSFYALYGKWTDDYKSSWHQDYNLYFSRDPIKLDPSLNLYLGTGIEQVHESYDGSTQNIYKFDATLAKTWSPRLSLWVGYHYTRNNATLFDYERTDLAKELDTGFSYRMDRLNAISFNQSYDLNNNRVYDQDITWHRNLHCWEAAITYRIKRQQIVFDINTVKW
ncbi:OstA family protein [Thermosinus carboxydivorans Nor1]|uniref:OstA family protein n=1 Tax=Thermosinus carboxydivorans Nor1 TaxID=401526 RepID=A1HRH1_9FIRM|nr:LptA/OstA family protein [Thermosinus carboxydivorans]EAX47302.1 OstA family protein [Thermosinus carboxydivorans Nor1]